MTKEPPRLDAKAANVRAGADAWVLAAFLLVLGVVAAAPAPSASAPLFGLQLQGGKAPQRGAAADTAHREAIRAHSFVVRVLLPKDAGGGKDLFGAREPRVLVLSVACVCPSRDDRCGDDVSTRGFDARAPPALTA